MKFYGYMKGLNMQKVSKKGLLILLLAGSTGFGQVNKGSYIPKYIDPVLDQLEKERELTQKRADSLLEVIRDRQAAQKKQAERKELIFKSDLGGIQKPASVDAFKPLWHWEPVAQYQSGMCWCFCGTSFLESEVFRLTHQTIKLSELHTVYYEYVEKARRYLEERGDSHFAEGGEVNGVFRTMAKYGAVPADVYTGLLKGDKHDHTFLIEELTNFLEYCKEHDYWDVEPALAMIKVILNKHLGEPPQKFVWKEQTYTPTEFLQKVLKLNLADYRDVMSTSEIPFYTRGEFKVPDNWWHDSSYINLPMEEWYNLIKKAVVSGYTVAIGGDVGDAGYLGFEDVAFVPDFDIPADKISQSARDLRIFDGTTADDHGLHLVGYTKVGNWDWFLIKDSGRSSRWGAFKGYYFWRGDFVKLKMLSYTVHKDVLKEILPKVK